MRLSKKQGEILRQAQDDSFPALIYRSVRGFSDALRSEVRSGGAADRTVGSTGELTVSVQENGATRSYAFIPP